MASAQSRSGGRRPQWKRPEPREPDGAPVLWRQLAEGAPAPGPGESALSNAAAPGPGESALPNAAAPGAGESALPNAAAPGAGESAVSDAAAPASCTPAPGLTPGSCGAYARAADYLPDAYVQDATCACRTTPDEPRSNCIRAFLQARMAAWPASLKSQGRFYKALAALPTLLTTVPLASPYDVWVQTVLTPRIYQDHVDAYRNCCCAGPPAPYPAWIGVTTVPLPCEAVRQAILWTGSCSADPGNW